MKKVFSYNNSEAGWTRIFISLVLVAATAAIYWQVATHGFINFDDNLYVTENQNVISGITAEGIIWAFTSVHAANWHPLTWISHMLDCQLFGLDAGMHHLVNLIIHLLNSILLFFVLGEMSGKVWRSAFVAFLFALHPLHIESVAWIAERKDVLSTFFWMLTLWFYTRYTQKGGKWYPLAMLFFVMGLMAKPMLVTLPFVLLLLDYWPLGRILPVDKRTPGIDKENGLSLTHVIIEKIPFLALATVSTIITFVAQRGGGAVVSVGSLPINERVANALVSYLAYLEKMVWPFHLAVFYPHRDVLPFGLVFAAGALIAGITIAVLAVYRKYPYLPVGWLWYLGTLVPVIGVVQVGAQAMADRYTYVPLIGVFVMIAWIVPDLAGKWRLKRQVIYPSATAVIIFLMIAAYTYIGYWKDSTTLFAHALAVTDKNNVAHENLAGALMERGDFSRAVYHYREALQLASYDKKSHHNLGIALTKIGKDREAAEHFLGALRIDPDYPEAHNNLGLILVKVGDLSGSISHFSRALQSRPNWAEAHNNMGSALVNLGESSNAVKHFKKALQIDPDYMKAHLNLGFVLAGEGKTDQAILHYLEALRVDPGCVKAHNNIGNIFLRTGKIDRAIHHFQKALEIDPANPELKGKLKASLSYQGKIKDSIARYKNRLETEPENPELYYVLGNLYKSIGKIDEAIEYYQGALEVEEGYVPALSRLAVVYGSRGKDEKALEVLKKIAKLSPGSADAYYNIACICSKQGDAQESIRWLKGAVERGFEDWELLKTDTDLNNIRMSSYYRELVANK